MSQYPVITSRAAKKDYGDIQARHADLLMGMAAHEAKVSQFRQQKAAEMQNQATMKNEMDKAKLTANTETQKNAMDFHSKQSELDIKRAALSAK